MLIVLSTHLYRFVVQNLGPDALGDKGALLETKEFEINKRIPKSYKSNGHKGTVSYLTLKIEICIISLTNLDLFAVHIRDQFVYEKRRKWIC